jgi:hypothetical protein
MFGGFTNGKKLSALCEINHIDIAPHHDCYIHAPLVASTPSGRIVESFDTREILCRQNYLKILIKWIMDGYI